MPRRINTDSVAVSDGSIDVKSDKVAVYDNYDGVVVLADVSTMMIVMMPVDCFCRSGWTDGRQFDRHSPRPGPSSFGGVQSTSSSSPTDSVRKAAAAAALP